MWHTPATVMLTDITGKRERDNTRKYHMCMAHEYSLFFGQIIAFSDIAYTKI